MNNVMAGSVSKIETGNHSKQDDIGTDIKNSDEEDILTSKQGPPKSSIGQIIQQTNICSTLSFLTSQHCNNKTSEI